MKIKKTLLFSMVIACCMTLLACQPVNDPPNPTNLLTEGKQTPLNVHSSKPRFSWLANVKKQAFYQIHVASSATLLNNNQADLWDSGKTPGQASRNIAYQGSPLNSSQQVFWRVRAWAENEDNAGPWSKNAQFDMGLLTKTDWQAKWLQVATPKVIKGSEAIEQWINLVATVENEDGSIDAPALDKVANMPTAAYFRHEFAVDKQVIGAKLHSTAGGYYEIFINNKRVDERLMDPGQTDFDKRILYNTDEVTPLLQKGSNTIAVHLGSGWYDEGIAFSRWKNPDGEYAEKESGSYSFGQPTFIAQLELRYADGSTELVVSDEHWQSHASPVLKEGIFSGELFDANSEIANWKLVDGQNGFDDWQQAKALNNWPTKRLEPQLLPPVRAVKAIQPVAILQPKPNVWVFDFGQNFTGVPTLHLDKLDLKQGQAIYLRYAEWQDDKGNISQLSGGSWATHLNAVDGYIAAGDNKVQTWQPTFTWRGFRYIEITGLTKQPPLEALSAHLIRSDVARVGQFTSSDPLINRIHDTALWTYESNLISIPMDCPLREKAGWTGDAHATLVTANYNFNLETFWPKYLGDFQTALHTAPIVVPGKRTGGGKVDWAVAEVFVAWEHYRHHGDKQVLTNQYQSLLEYMDFGKTQMSEYLIEAGFGDWCDPVPAPGVPRVGGRGTPQWTTTAVTSTALFAQAANYMSKIAEVLNKPNAQQHYQTLYNNLAQGFHNAFYDEQTQHYGSQTADAMALRFGLTPEPLRQKVANALNKDVVEKWQGHSSVGALGQTWLYLALSDYGYTDTAFNIFKAKGYPGFSYLFDELNGTTLWERKGAFDPNKGRGPLRSLNHPFHGGYDGWFYQGLGGIRPLEHSVGFQQFRLKPVFPRDLAQADVRYNSGYGEIKSHWQRQGDTITWQVSIPNNTSAWVELPDREKKLYVAGNYRFEIKVLNKNH